MDTKIVRIIDDAHGTLLCFGCGHSTVYLPESFGTPRPRIGEKVSCLLGVHDGTLVRIGRENAALAKRRRALEVGR